MNLDEGTILAIYKPKGMTSHDVVNIIRKKSGIKRVGHGGTLDPLAEGVLVIGIGRSATKTLDTYTLGEKEYEAVIKLGETSTTDDEEGEKHPFKDGPFKVRPSAQEVKDVLRLFVGKIQQTPPIYSAIKIKGKPAYKYARTGKNDDVFMNQFINTKTREVEITNIRLVTYHYPLVTLIIECNKGVYIRSLARDIGEKLGTGAYLADLKRTKVGKFQLNDCIKIPKT